MTADAMSERAPDQSRHDDGNSRLYVSGAGARERTGRPHRPVLVRGRAVRDGDRDVPFRGESSGVIFDAIMNRSPVSAVRLNPDLPPKLEDIINRALEKDRELRYQHASDIRTELQV